MAIFAGLCRPRTLCIKANRRPPTIGARGFRPGFLPQPVRNPMAFAFYMKRLRSLMGNDSLTFVGKKMQRSGWVLDGD